MHWSYIFIKRNNVTVLTSGHQVLVGQNEYCVYCGSDNQRCDVHICGRQNQGGHGLICGHSNQPFQLSESSLSNLDKSESASCLRENVVEKFYSRTHTFSGGNLLGHGGQRVRPGQLHGSAVDEALAEAEAKRVQVEPAPVAH